MFEIWRHIRTGERYLVVVRDGRANVAAGPLPPEDDTRVVLETRGNQNHNPRALLDMRRMLGDYAREYTTDARGSAAAIADTLPQ